MSATGSSQTASPSFDISATPTISLQPYPTNREGPEFSGTRRAIIIVVGIIAAVFLLLLLFLGEYLLRRDRRRRLLATPKHEPPPPLDVDSGAIPVSLRARQASEHTADQIMDLPDTTVPGSASARHYPEVYNQGLHDDQAHRSYYTVAMQSLPTSSASVDSHAPVLSSAASAQSIATSQAPSVISGPSLGRNPTLSAAIEVVASYAQLNEMQRQALYSSLDAETSSAMRQSEIASAATTQGENTGPDNSLNPPPYK